MGEIARIINMYDSTDHLQMAIATVVYIEDSSYRQVGARMLIAPDGSWVGGVSGGCLEGDILKHAQHVILTGKAKMIRYDTRDHDPSQIGVGLGCHGLIDVWISAVDRSQPANIIELLRHHQSIREAQIMVTVLDSDDDRWRIGSFLKEDQINNAESSFGRHLSFDQIAMINGDLSKIKQDHSSAIISLTTNYGNIRLFMEVVIPVIRLYIYGYHYDVLPMIQLARDIGWEIYVIAPKRKICAQWLDVGARCMDPENEVVPDEFSAVVLMAHDYQTDLNNLKKSIGTSASYIGMLGPRDRKDDILQQVSKELRHKLVGRLYAPIGLDIGATTPATIALSILAEITAHFNQRSGGLLRDRLERINEN